MAVVYIWPKLSKAGQKMMEEEIAEAGYSGKKAVSINGITVWRCT